MRRMSNQTPEVRRIRSWWGFATDMWTRRARSWEVSHNHGYSISVVCLLLDRLCSNQVDSFNAPFLNQYFQRVWTVQEIAMAHSIRIHYGAKIVSWRDFVASALFAVKRGGFARNQEADIDVFRDSEIHWNLLNCLESHFVLPDIYGVEALYNRVTKETS